jgi:hypothetical protein
MNDLDLLIEQPKELKLGGKKIIVKEMVAKKALKTVELYNKANNILLEAINTKSKKLNIKDANFTSTSKLKNIDSVVLKTRLMKKYQDAIIKVCLYIIKPRFDICNRKSLEYIYLTKNWLYKNATVKQLESFIKIILEPILGDEALKKIQAVEQILKK